MSRTGISIGKRLTAALFAATLFLSACDSAEERAEAHFQAGMAHLEQGDVERALVEFRNVFKLNGRHKEARLTFARLERERGNIPIAYGQYLRLVEQFPDNFESQFALAEMALEVGNWEDVRRHGIAAAELEPENIEVQSINNTLAYTDAVRDGSAAGTNFAVHTARELIKERPDLMTARNIVIDSLVRKQDWYDVLDEVDAALVVAPKQDNLYAIRIRALQELNKPAEIEKQLRSMMLIYPDDRGVEQMLVQHYIDRDNLDAAEAVLREEVVPQAEDYHPAQRLVAFLNEYRSPQAAISEMDAIIAQGGPNTPKLKTIRATLKFHSGDEQTALAEMKELVENSERTTQTRENEVEFARMLFQAGKSEEGRALIEKILSEDATQVDALKFKAAWLIEEDNTGDAIALLREALGEAPRDPQLMTLMAGAHERNGDRELMGEMLALAAETSQGATVESLSYAQYLIAEGDLKIAESVLINALRRNSDNRELLPLLGQIYLRMQDWGRLEAVLNSLSDLDEAEAQRVSKELRAQMLAAQNRSDDLTDFLNELADDPEFGLPADIALIRSMLAQGDAQGAFGRLDQKLAENPGSLPLQFVKARALTSENKLDEARGLYRKILADYPDTAQVWVALHTLETRHGKPEDARAVLSEALNEIPQSPEVLMLLAATHERDGDLDQAIAVYEKLYPLSNHSLVVANNLASLLTTHRSDDESLQRAQILARRLRGTRIPAFQDTYGWIAYRVGNYDEALIYLEPAARAFPDQPLVLYHLGKAYAALDRNEDALRTYQAAQALGHSPDVTSALEDEIERLRTTSDTGQ